MRTKAIALHETSQRRILETPAHAPRCDGAEENGFCKPNRRTKI